MGALAAVGPALLAGAKAAGAAALTGAKALGSSALAAGKFLAPSAAQLLISESARHDPATQQVINPFAARVGAGLGKVLEPRIPQVPRTPSTPGEALQERSRNMRGRKG